VGENLQAGHRVRFGVVAQQKIADRLICVGEMRMRLNPDEAAESTARLVSERIFVKKIARRVRTGVILQGAGVEFLAAIGHANGEEIAPRAFAGEPAQTLEARVRSTEMDIQTQAGRVARHGSGVDLDREYFVIPGLRADVIDLCSLTDHEIVYAAGEPAAVPMRR